VPGHYCRFDEDGGFHDIGHQSDASVGRPPQPMTGRNPRQLGHGGLAQTLKRRFSTDRCWGAFGDPIARELAGWCHTLATM
jgi:hypothetical protein